MTVPLVWEPPLIEVAPVGTVSLMMRLVAHPLPLLLTVRV